MTPRKAILMRKDLETVPSLHDPQRDRTVMWLWAGGLALGRQNQFMFSNCVTLRKHSTPVLICKMGQHLQCPVGIKCEIAPGSLLISVCMPVINIIF